MEPLVIMLVVTSLQVAATLYGAKPTVSVWRAVTIPLVFCALGLVIFNVAFFMLVVLMPVVVGIVAAFRVRRNVIAVASFVCTFLVWGAITASTYSEVRQTRDLRREFDFESIANRLEYEPPMDSSQSLSAVVLSEDSKERLAAMEKERTLDLRTGKLYQLHQEHYLKFIEASGFGVVRMRRVHRDHLLILPPEPLPLPARPQELEPPTAIQFPQLAAEDSPLGNREIASLHDSGLADFLAPERIGLVKSPRQVAGFVPHAFAKSLPLAANESLSSWQVSRLELVSLLKHVEPRVYLSEYLPRMEELRHAETRPVDEFEQRSLQQLRDGENIVTDQQLNTVRMVGAVRAAKQCLDCHSVRRGDLLGAFSYLLDRKQPLPPSKFESKPVSMSRKPAQDT